MSNCEQTPRGLIANVRQSSCKLPVCVPGTSPLRLKKGGLIKHSILIVDDDQAVRETLESLLVHEGYTVLTADHGLNALQHLNISVPELIISDLYMPLMSGFDLLPIVRNRFPHISIIATSGAFAGDQVPAGVTADLFYPKGSSMKLLLGMISNLLDETRTRGAHV